MLGAVLFLFLLFVLVGVAIWYYYTWTPMGVLKNIESQVDSSQLLKTAAVKAKYVDEAQQDINKAMQGVNQKINPVKNFKDSDPMHPECLDVPELCPVCLEETLDANGECPDIFYGRPE